MRIRIYLFCSLEFWLSTGIRVTRTWNPNQKIGNGGGICTQNRLGSGIWEKPLLGNITLRTTLSVKMRFFHLEVVKAHSRATHILGLELTCC